MRILVVYRRQRTATGRIGRTGATAAPPVKAHHPGTERVCHLSVQASTVTVRQYCTCLIDVHVHVYIYTCTCKCTCTCICCQTCTCSCCTCNDIDFSRAKAATPAVCARCRQRGRDEGLRGPSVYDGWRVAGVGRLVDVQRQL